MCIQARPKKHLRSGRSTIALLCMAFLSCWSLSVPVFAKAKKPTQISRPLTTQQIARLVLPSVVRLVVSDASGHPTAQGSGLVVGTNLIATNIHVIAGAHTVVADFGNGHSETVYGVVAVDNERDLALLYANTKGLRPLLLSTGGTAQVGDPVVAVGSPEGLGGSISTGIISAIRTVGGTKILQTTAPISPGSSGGGLIDSNGRVLGITSFYLKGGQNLNFAYAAGYLKSLIPTKVSAILTWDEAVGTAAASTPTNTTPNSPSGGASGLYAPENRLRGIHAVRLRIINRLTLTNIQLNATQRETFDFFWQPGGLYEIYRKQLVDNGITVYPYDDKVTNNIGTLPPLLSVSVSNGTVSSGGVFTCRVDVELYGLVTNIGDRILWYDMQSEKADSESLNADMLFQSGDSLDKFCRDYKAQN